MGTLRQGAAVTSLAFSPDGTMLASTGSDGTLILWDVSLATWLTTACHVANRDFTTDEWTHFLGTEEYHATCTGR